MRLPVRVKVRTEEIEEKGGGRRKGKEEEDDRERRGVSQGPRRVTGEAQLVMGEGLRVSD